MENQEIKHAELLGHHAGSHHGSPDLFERDIKLLQDYQLWVKTANDAAEELLARTGYKSSYHKDTWVPSVPDMLKSRLFWRIRAGKAPLPKAPPTCYSCAWYEVIEVPGPHDGWPDEIRTYKPEDGVNRPIAYVNQCAYDLIEECEDGSYLLEYSGYYRFRAWNGMIPTRTVVNGTVVDTESKGCWIEYIGTK